MSDAASALAGAATSGYVDILDAGLVGMITIRGDQKDARFRDTLHQTLGLNLPDARKLVANDSEKLLWMSPDELLLICGYAEAEARAGALSSALSGIHHLVVNVSDARAVIDVMGSGAEIREALAKLTPADLRPATLGVGEVRRTRLAQVPAAIWFDTEDRATIVCFRSVGDYVFGLLSNAARPGSAVGHF